MMMWGMEIGKRLAEKRIRNTADLRKDIRFIFWNGICAVLSEGKHNNNNCYHNDMYVYGAYCVDRQEVYRKARLGPQSRYGDKPLKF